MFSAPPIPSSTQPAPSTENAQGEDEDQPPKVEIKQVRRESMTITNALNRSFRPFLNCEGRGKLLTKILKQGRI